jgi:glycosyltransferase involved in cell wall biosynthesis
MYNRNIKVCHITFSDHKGGAAIATRRLNECLKDSKIKSKIYSLDINNNKSISLKRNFCNKVFFLFCRILEIFLRKSVYWNSKTIHSFNFFTTNVNKKIKKFNPDIVHLHYLGSNTISLKDIYLLNKPLVWTFHDMWPILDTEHLNYSGIKTKNNFIANFINKKIRNQKKKYFKRKITIVAPSRWMKKEVLKSNFFINQKLHIVPNPIDIKLWKSINLNNKSFNHFKKKITIGYCVSGIDQFHKGYDLFKKILFNLEKKLKFKIRLICFGDKKFKNLNFYSDKIEVISYPQLKDEKELIEIYSSLDLLLVTSRVESFCQVASEAMSCSVPVVAFKVGGLIDLIQNNKTGWLVEKFSTKKFAAIVNSYINNYSNQIKIKKNCRNYVVMNLDYKNIQKKYEKIYREVLEK